MAKRPMVRTASLMQRQVKAHARILVAIVAGILVWFAARNFLPVTRFLIAWNTGVWLFLLLALKMIATASVADLKKRAGLEDEGRIATLIIVLLATTVAFIALGLELSEALRDKAQNQTLRITIALAAILGSWLFYELRLCASLCA